MSRVSTEVGMVERADLEVRDIITEEDNSRAIACEWRLLRELHDAAGKAYPAGLLVRRDAWVNSLRGLEMGSQAGATSGE